MGRGHAHTSTAHTGSQRRLTIVLAVALLVLAADLVGAWLTGSLALLADAGHMFADGAGLCLALLAARLAGRPASDQRTWGLRRAEVLAAAVQAAILLAVGGYLVLEAISRLVTPPEVDAGPMVVFGLVAMLGSAIAVGVLSPVRRENLNLRAAYLEVLADALGSAAVVAAGLVVVWTQWLRADAVASLLIAMLIVPRTVVLLRESVDVLLESTPAGLDLTDVRRHVLGVPHVQAIHDLHASQVATGVPVVSAHVVVDDACFHDGHLTRLLDDVQDCLASHFDVAHSTIQFEAASHVAHEPAAHD